jgi:endonuclease/exonuclease/phosphatase family metal-dependent hydrolase
MLPSFIYFTGKRQRSTAIGKYLKSSDYDIVVLQETFKHGARRRIKRQTKETFQYKIGPAFRRYVSLRTSSGVWILSKYPIKTLGKTKYKEKEGFDNKMARKGALMVQMNKNGTLYNFIGTHINAGGSAATKCSQVVQIQQLIEKKHNDSIPLFVCGDFNIDKTEKEYQFILDTLNVTDGPLTGRQCTVDGSSNDFHVGEQKCEVIDFIFYSEKSIQPNQVYRRLPIIEYKWSDMHKSLSDHEPVEMIIKF